MDKKEFDRNTYKQIIDCLIFYAETKNHKKNQESKISHIDKDFGRYARQILKKINVGVDEKNDIDKGSDTTISTRSWNISEKRR